MSDIAGHLKGIRAKIAEHGHAVQHVAGAEAGASGWSYTIGLHVAGLPELIIIGGPRAARAAANPERPRRSIALREALRVGERDPRVSTASM